MARPIQSGDELMSTKAILTRSWLLLRLGLAALVGLYMLVRVHQGLGIVTVPNPGSVVGWRNTLCLTAIIAPLLFVFIGAAYSRIAEIIGWGLLLTLFFLAVSS